MPQAGCQGSRLPQPGRRAEAGEFRAAAPPSLARFHRGAWGRWGPGLGAGPLSGRLLGSLPAGAALPLAVCRQGLYHYALGSHSRQRGGRRGWGASGERRGLP